MESCWDFIKWLGPDLATSVLMCLDDPADLVCLAAVSRSWRQFAIANDFFKKLCFRLCPEVSIFSCATEVSTSKEIAGIGSGNYEWECQKKDHRIYSYLSHRLASPAAKSDCIYEPIGASSTDNPDEGIENTLEPRDRVHAGPSYWSSKGENDPGVPEMLTYRLWSKLCVIDEIRVQPFKAFFQHGHPIYSAKVVRFRMGYSKVSQETRTDTMDKAMYGHILHQDIQWISVCHAQVIGRKLSPVFDVDTTRNPVLKYFPDARACTASGSALADEARESVWNSFVMRIRQLRKIAYGAMWFALFTW